MDHTPRTFDAAFVLPEGGTTQDGAWQRHDPNFADSYEYGKSCIAKREGAYQLFGPVPPIESLNAHTFSPVRHGVGSVHRKGNKNYALNPSFEAPETGEVVTNFAPNPSGGATAPTSVFTNEVYNPSMEAVSATPSVVNTNLVTNPRAETVSAGTDTLRTNLCTNPSFETNATGWTGGVAVTRVITEARTGTACGSFTTTAGTGAGFDFATVVGATYTLSCYVKSYATSALRIDLRGQAGGVDANSAEITPGTSWVRLVVTGTASTAASRLYLRAAGAGTFLIEDVLIEQTDQLRAYFDGSTPDALGWDYGWTGTAHVSSSTAKALAVAVNTNLVTNPSAEAVSTGTTVLRTNLLNDPSGEVAPFSGNNPATWTTAHDSTVARRPGTKSTRSTVLVSDPLGYVLSAYAINGTLTAIPAAAGQQFSAAAYFRTNTAARRAFISLAWRTASAAIGSTDGAWVDLPVGQWTRVEVTGTAPAGTVAVFTGLYVTTVSGAAPAGEQAWVDDVLLTPGSLLGDYFDGATPDALGWDYGWTGAANASTSTAKAAAVAVNTNLVTNPAARATTTPVAIRRNLATNPSVAVDAVGWFANGGAAPGAATGARVAAAGFSGSHFYRVTWTAAPPDRTGGWYYSLPTIVAGTTYTVSAYVRTQKTQKFAPTLEWRNASNGTAGPTAFGPVVTSVTGVWTRISVTGVAPATATAAYFGAYLDATGTAWAVNDTLEGDAILAEASGTLGSYFDGATAAAGDYTYAWTGTANASTSEERAAGIATWIAAGFSPAPHQVSVPWSVSGKALRGTTTGAGTHYISDGGSTAAAVGQQFILKAKASADQACQLRLSAWWRDAVGATISTSAGPIVEVTAGQIVDLVGPSTAAPANAATVRLNVYVYATGGGTPPKGITVSISNALLALGDPADATLGYFDGSTAVAGDFTYAWSGTADASTSVQRAPGVEGWLLNSTSGTMYYSATQQAVAVRFRQPGQVAAFLSSVGTLPGQVSTAYVEARSDSASGTFMATADFYGTAGWLGSAQGAGPKPVGAAWSSSRSYGPAPAGANGVAWVSWLDGFSAGDIVYLSRALLAVGSADYAGPYFDGDTPAAGDFIYAWTGTANASTSVKRAPQAAGIPAGPWQTTRSDGKAFRRMFDAGQAFPGYTVAADASVFAGTKYTVLAEVLSEGTSLTNNVYLQASAGGTTVYDIQPATNGQWAARRLVITVPSGVTSMTVSVLVQGNANVAGALQARRIAILQGDYTGSYFDGDTAAAGDFTYAWTGVPHASRTEQRAPKVLGWNTSQVGGKAYQRAGGVGGGLSLALISDGSSTTTQVLSEYRAPGVGGGEALAGGPAVQAGEAYTLIAWVRRPSAGVVYAKLRSGSDTGTFVAEDLGSIVTIPANTWTEYRHTFVVPAGSATRAGIRLLTDALPAGEVIEWDNVALIKEANYSGPYFDGTSGWYADSVFAWSGVAHLSTSTRTTNYPVILATNLVANPSAEAASGIVTVDTNLVTNPSAEAVTPGTTVLRTNLSQNPAAGTTVDDWYGEVDPVRVATGGPLASAPSFARVTFDAAYPPESVGFLHDVYAPIIPNAPYTLSLYVRVSRARKMRAGIKWGAPGNVTLGTSYGSSVLVPANTWVRLSVTATAPASTTWSNAYAHSDVGEGNWLANDTLDASACLFEQTDQLRAYFDGATPDALGWDYGWSFTAHASTSTAKALAVAVRTNLVTNPRFAGDPPSPWFGYGGPGGSGTVARVASGGPDGGGHGRFTWTVAPSGVGGGLFFGTTTGTNYLPVTPGASYAGRAKVRASRKQRVGIVWHFYDAAGAQIGAPVVTGATVLQPNAWTDVVGAAVAPANAARCIPAFYAVVGTDAAVWAVNDTLDVAQVLVELGVAPGSYFDGATAAAGDFIYAWTGTANASSSVQRAPQAAGFTPVDVENNKTLSAYRSYKRAGSGAASIRLESTASQLEDEFVTFTVSGLTVGVQYTYLAWSFIESPGVAAAENQRALSLIGTTGQNLAWNVHGWATGQWVRRAYTFTAEGASMEARLYAFVGGVVHWDDIMVVRGDYTGSYFDGATTAAGDFTYVWTGTTHASTSRREAPGVASWSARAAAPLYQSAISPKNGTKCAAVKMLNVTGAGAQVSQVSDLSGTVTAKVAVRGAVGGEQIQVSLFYLSGSPAAEVLLKSSGTVVLTTAWQTVSVTGTLPPGAHTVRLIVTRAETAERLFYIDEAMIVSGSDDVPYFDGSYAITDDYHYSWVGIGPNAISRRAARATVLRGNGAVGGLLHRISNPGATPQSGKVHALAAPLAVDQRFEPVIPGLEPGQEYILKVWLRRSTPDAKWRVQVVAPDGGGSPVAETATQTVSTTGYTEFTLQFTATRLSHMLKIRSDGADARAGVTYLGGILLTVSDYSGGYFDGSTTGDPQFVFTWSGSPYDSASVRTSSGLAVRSVNKILNPSARASNSDVTVRTNLVLDPTPAAVGSLSAARSTLSAQDGYVRASITDNTALLGAQRIQLATAAALIPVTAGRTYTLSADIRSNAGCPGLVQILFYDASKIYITDSQVTGAAIDVNDVSFRRAHATGVAPSTAAYVGFYITIDNSSGQADIGNWIDARNLLFELSGKVEPYFDGDTPIDRDFSYAWSGTPNASTSVQRAPSATHWAGTRGTVWRSTEVPQLDRYAAAYRVTELGTSPVNNYTMVQSSPRAEVVPGETVTAVASAYFPPGSGVDIARILVQFYTSSGSATSPIYGDWVDVGSDGMVALRSTRIVPDDAVSARLVLYPESSNGLPPEVGTVWYWGRAALMRGTRAEYFDGDSPDAVWFSTPDASQSALVADAPPDLWLPPTVTSDFIAWTTPAGDGLRGRRALALESFYETNRDDYVSANVAVPGPGTYTVLAYSKLPSFDSGVEDPEDPDGYPGLGAISGGITFPPTDASLVTGAWTEHRMMIIVPAGSSEIELRLYAIPGTVIWWDEVAVVPGDYSGAYFDGSTEEINSWEGEPETSVSVLAATGGYVYDLANRGTAASAFAASAWVEGTTNLVLRFGAMSVTVDTTANAANFSVFGATQSLTVGGDSRAPMLIAASVDGENATVYAGREDGSLAKAEIAIPVETSNELTSVEFGRNTDHAAVENVLVYNTSISEADVARGFAGWASDFIDDDRIVFAHATESLQFSSEAYTGAGFGHRRMTTPESVRAQIFPVDGSFARIATSEPMAWAPGQHVVADGARYRIIAGGGDSYMLVRA